MAQVKTKNGYDFFAVSSAFQKSIRRGLEHEALYWATELYLSGYGEYCWYRMTVIVSEDIGIGSPNLPATFEALYSAYQRMKAKNNKHAPEKLQFVHAVLLLVRAQKSRMVDMKLCYYFGYRDKIEKLDIPDWVYDQHTARGRALGRGNDFFYAEGGKIANQSSHVPDEDEFKQFIWKLEAEAEGKSPSHVEEDPPEKQGEQQMSMDLW